MTKTEKRELFITFDRSDVAEAFDHEFTGSAAISFTSENGQYTSVSFDQAHIPALEAALNFLYAHRGDYDDVIRPQVAELVAA
jgi:hypothetical protein